MKYEISHFTDYDANEESLISRVETFANERAEHGWTIHSVTWLETRAILILQRSTRISPC